MSYRRTSFTPGEWYHCYSRSIDKQTVFLDEQDFRRFLQALYLANSDPKINRGDFRNYSHDYILCMPRGISLVNIAAYALMPNHFHILLQEKEVHGTSKFMQKLGTSFAMYFNEKYDHVGNVFIKPFRAKHISSDEYLRRVRQYIHLNPAELFEPRWKEGKVQNLYTLETKLQNYFYTSIPDYYQPNGRIEKAILDPEAMNFLHEAPELLSVLKEARDYYLELHG